MSTPVPPRSPGLPSPTRQQLDELDALLQRMLALPVNPLDEPNPTADPAATPASTVSQPAAEVSSTGSTSTAAAEGFSVRTLSLIQLGSSQPESPASGNGTVSSPTARVAVAEPGVAPVSSPAPAERERVPTPLWLRPLVWGNRIFDRCAGLLGAPGRWLRRPWGRTLLGLTGLLLLAAALGWMVLDWMGWPWWPVALKW
jgi:hypothetical protein